MASLPPSQKAADTSSVCASINHARAVAMVMVVAAAGRGGGCDRDTVVRSSQDDNFYCKRSAKA